MLATAGGRVLLIILCLSYSNGASYNIPDVTIQAFTPKGFRASVPDAENLTLFAFQGNVNRPIESNAVGDISGEVTKKINGLWVFDLPEISLKLNDVIKYHVFVAINQAGYVKDGLEFKVIGAGSAFAVSAVRAAAAQRSSSAYPIALGDTLFIELKPYVPLPTIVEVTTKPVTTTTTTPAPECGATLTKLRGGRACAGQTIFEDNFDTLRDSVWQIEQYIPIEHPEVPYVSYQSSTVSVRDGILRIVPALQQNQPGWNSDSIINGSLNLFQGCTSSASFSCSAQAQSASIIPPIVSGRITSRPSFAFTYGTISVRAKLVQGDWLYPEILLEPFVKKFGFGPLNYKSGLLKIACARGNKLLYAGTSEYSNKVLYGGPIIEARCHDTLLSEKKSENFWGNDYHVYSMRWTPGRITLLVDDVEWGSATDNLHARLPLPCRGDAQSGMAPFDDHFYITLGVAAGGVTEFLDGLFTNGGLKPWRNRGSKATLNFWENYASWYSTWENPELLVDYVKVVAL